MLKFYQIKNSNKIISSFPFQAINFALKRRSYGMSSTTASAPTTATANGESKDGATASTTLYFHETEGDLFTAPKTFSLAHCVASDFGMGAGIAVMFKKVFGKVDELTAQGAQTGQMAFLKDDQRYIYYLVTKPCSWDRPTYSSLRASLETMREHMNANQVDKLAIPRIGCGIDGLEWGQVSDMLKDVFGKEKLEIVVYNFVPK